MGRTKPKSVSADYVVGLTDGEGCFYVLARKSPAYKAGRFIQLHFHLKMQKADKDLLFQVKERMGCGGVYFQNELRPNHTQCYRYTVASNSDVIQKVIPFFLRHPLQSASKRRSFMIFCKIAKLIEQQKHLTKSGAEKISRLKRLMNQKHKGLA